ncbi:HIF prolyl hydroxylase [Dermatophagoides pteronyssinus]|uniref:HIF prolyl hydroxylase n=1 Tax=Dermatophagoides pteronyssinus TaxID=6956 RepID=UPI003F6812E2
MSCEVCGKTDNLKSCGRCLKANYCGREHQLEHWKQHKHWCMKNVYPHNNNINNNHYLDNNNDNDSIFIDNNNGHHPQQQQQNLMLFEQQQQLNQQQQEMFSSLQSSSDQSSSSSSNDDILMMINGQQLNQQQPPPTNQIDLVNNFNSTINSLNNHPTDNINNFDSSTSTIHVNHHHQDEEMTDFFTQHPPQVAIANNNILNNSHHQQQQFNNFRNQSFNLSNHHQQQYLNRDNVLKDLNKYCQIILQDMNKYGFCVIDDFLQNGDLILNEVTLLYKKGFFQPGQVVNIKANSNSKLIRGDRITWVEGNEQICLNIGFLIRILDSIITRCNNLAFGEFQKYRITRRTKAMIACYPSNFTKYVRHVDNPNNDGRCITSIYYLNKDYSRERDGGVLRLFPQMNDGIVADIEPRFNRVIFFWSDRRNPHEVMPSTRMRFAITVWYFDANERERAIQKYRENSMQCPNDKDLVPF